MKAGEWWVTRGAAETEAMGFRLAGESTAGMAVGLSGELGSGKTQWVRGFVRGLGSRARVHSPTFALLNQYEGGRWPVCHLDLYRLPDCESVCRAGLDSYIVEPEGVAVIEWVEHWWTGAKASGCLPARFWLMRFEWQDEESRRITCVDAGD